VSSSVAGSGSAAATATVGRRLSRSRHAHRVQFYDQEDHLYEAVTAHLAAGLLNGEPVAIIATETHRRVFEGRLQRAGCEVAAAQQSGQLQMVDARAWLAGFMVEGMPSAELLRLEIGKLIEAAARFRPNVKLRVYGEMVDLLAQEGNATAALRLEQQWNELSQQQAVSLLCAYAMDSFREAADGGRLEQVCSCHTDVEPAESFQAQAGAVGLNRQVVLLQQQARALQTELEHRRQLEGELWRKNAVLSRTAGFGELFVSAVGYDLRSPLLAMVTAAGMMLHRSHPDDVGRLAQRILASAGRMDRMIDQLVDFARIRLGQGLALTCRTVDLRPLCHDVLEEVEGVDEARPVLIDAQGDTTGCWDRDRLGQLVLSLMGNAVTHGERTRPVTVHLDGSAGDRVLLEVRNAGEIPPALQPLLFEPFRMAEVHTPVGASALGMGLYLGDQIVRAHGGDIRVDSSRADGTCFRVSLPRAAMQV
jgi:signal transduction histidine kinase